MGSVRPEREYQRALADYLAAARELVASMAAWEAAKVPLLPGPDGALPSWTPHQIRTTVAAAQAWRQLAIRRRELDRCAGAPGARPAPPRPPEPDY